VEREDRIRELLAQLNSWAQMQQKSQSGDPLAKDKGEANARIDDLKAQLAALEVKVRWNGQEYVVVSASNQGPDENFGKP
jgi:uncharacterized protein YceH (UPF0502 family)